MSRRRRLRSNPMRYYRGRRRFAADEDNPRLPKAVVWGAVALGGWLLVKRFGAAASAGGGALRPRAEAAAGMGAYDQSRYRALKRGSGMTCYDVVTKAEVDASFCEAELLQGVGGVFG